MANGQELKNYKTAIQEALSTQFPEFYISVFSRIDDDCELPAIVVNLPVLERTLNAQNPAGKMRQTVQTAAFVIYSAADENNEIECLQSSANISNFINGNRFSQPFPAVVTLNEPMIVEGLENFIIQRIDFEQNIEIISKS